MNKKTEETLVEKIFKERKVEFKNTVDAVEQCSEETKEILKYAAEKMMERENYSISTAHAVSPVIMTFLVAILGFVFAFFIEDTASVSLNLVGVIISIIAFVAVSMCAIILMVSYHKVVKASDRRYSEFVEMAVACYTVNNNKVSYEATKATTVTTATTATTETVANVATQSPKKQKK